jgi:hypothetical protein
MAVNVCALTPVHTLRTNHATKEPYQRVIWAIREMVCGKKRGMGGLKTPHESVWSLHPACIKAWGRTSKGSSEDVTCLQNLLSWHW